MPAIVRVKRRIDEEPLSAFVLNGKKRRRLAEGGDGSEVGAANENASDPLEGKDEISTILKFAGTITQQDNAATTQLARLTKEEAKELVQQKMRKPMNHTERARQEMRQSLHEQRFRVVNCLRTDAITTDEDGNSVSGNESNSNATTKPVTIVDIEKQSKITTAATATAASAATTTTLATASTAAQQDQQPSDSDTGYVYDLYIPENEQQAEYVDLMDDNYLSVRAFDDLVYDERYDNNSDDEYDSEDSNQENHFGNDYPDEQSGSDDQYEDVDDEREIRHGIRNFVLADDDDDDILNASSSDEEDVNVYHDPYVHTVDANDDSFVDDIDACDVERYGTAYARYKKRILKNLQNDDSDDQSDDNDSDDERYHSASENDDCYD